MNPAQQAQAMIQRLQGFAPTQTPREQFNNNANTMMAGNPLAGQAHYNAAATAGNPEVAAAGARMSPFAQQRMGRAAGEVGDVTMRDTLLKMFPQLAQQYNAAAGMETQRYGGMAGANANMDQMRLKSLTGAMGGLNQTADLQARDKSLEATRVQAGVKNQGDVLRDRIAGAQQSYNYNNTQAANYAGWQGGANNWAGNQNTLPYIQAAQQAQAMIPNLQQQLAALGY